MIVGAGGGGFAVWAGWSNENLPNARRRAVRGGRQLPLGPNCTWRRVSPVGPPFRLLRPHPYWQGGSACCG